MSIITHGLRRLTTEDGMFVVLMTLFVMVLYHWFVGPWVRQKEPRSQIDAQFEQ